MALAPGTRLGPYEIVAPLGAGAMGEVYRARDTRLDRAVAIKILPEAFAADPERVARFGREARALAALNHPHIAQIYDVTDDRGVAALAMELVEGETLAERIARGPIPLGEAMPIARQLADALAAAHDQGIVHRDLKPANIKLRAGDVVKVLDFGLAKARAGVPTTAPPDRADSPTVQSPAVTQSGLIVGTAAYMSPEQARGRAVDQRADIWAFGVIVFEMLTGEAAFAGADVTEILARVIEREPDWHRLALHAPDSLVRSLRRCLQKDPQLRWRHAGDVLLDLDASSAATQAVPRRDWRGGAGWALAIAMAVVAAAAITWRRAPAGEPAVALELGSPPGASFGSRDEPLPALSPDGRRIVFTAGSPAAPRTLWLRSLDDDQARPLANTAGATQPFWAPDGQAIGFSIGPRLYRFDLSGGAPEVVCELPDGTANGAAWGGNGVILLGSSSGGIYRVAASGGTPEAITTARGEDQGHQWPVWLPGEERFLFRTGSGSIMRATLAGGTPEPILAADSRAEYVPPGYLLFVRGTALVAQPFDGASARPTGEAVALANVVRVGIGGRAAFSARSNVLTYRAGSGNEGGFQWDWHDADGSVRRTLPFKQLRHFALSPDGARLAVHTHEGRTANGEMWLLPLDGAEATRLTSGKLHDDYPVWSPDGTRLAVNVYASGLWIVRADGSEARERILPTATARPTDWTAHGDAIVFHSDGGATGGDIWKVTPGDPRPRVLVQTRFEEFNGVVSPDGAWLAYSSNESGRREVYVQPFAGPGRKTRVSPAGATHAKWDPAGAALYYWAADGQVMRVPVTAAAGTLQLGTPEARFTVPPPNAPFGSASDRHPYILGPRGRGLIAVKGAGGSEDTPLTVLLNWRGKLAKASP